MIRSTFKKSFNLEDNSDTHEGSLSFEIQVNEHNPSCIQITPKKYNAISECPPIQIEYYKDCNNYNFYRKALYACLIQLWPLCPIQLSYLHF